jgi:hypothetical protein
MDDLLAIFGVLPGKAEPLSMTTARTGALSKEMIYLASR